MLEIIRGHDVSVLTIGRGGREAALADAHARSHGVDLVYVAPGNDGMPLLRSGSAQVHAVPNLSEMDTKGILEFCQDYHITLIDIGPEEPLRGRLKDDAGLADVLRDKGFLVVGPGRKGAEIEWRKSFARENNERWRLNGPSVTIWRNPGDGSHYEAATEYLEEQPEEPRFIKADNLGGGKLALPGRTEAEQIARIRQLQRYNPVESQTFLIEEWMLNADGTEGEEASVFYFAGGGKVRRIGSAQDYKRALYNDEGENTGSMGANSPTGAVTEALGRQTDAQVQRMIEDLYDQGIDYRGIVYYSMMNTDDIARLTEFNCRYGAPEAETMLPGTTDYFATAMAIAEGKIDQLVYQHDGRHRVAVTLASRGYPGDYRAEHGKRIYGPKETRQLDNVRVYVAGTRIEDPDGEERHYINGGRLYTVVGEGTNVAEAHNNAYHVAAMIHGEDNSVMYRTDIPHRELRRYYNSLKWS